MPHAKKVGFYLVEEEKIYAAIHESGEIYFNKAQQKLVEANSHNLKNSAFHEVPRAIVVESDFYIGDTLLTGSVLNDGRRVIKDTSLFEALNRSRKGETRRVGFPPIIGSKSLALLVTEKYPHYLESIMPFEVAQFNGNTGKWYDANTIPMICDIYMEAEHEGLITASQEHILAQAKILLRSLARVGITALIDEATNYQEIRGKDELQVLLAKFISEELRPYSKEFDKEYFEQLFRLYKVPYDPTSQKRPRYFAKFTKKYVYDLLPPNVWEKLDSVNPNVYNSDNDRWDRKHRLHQYLTEDNGLKFLRGHLDILIPVMKLSIDMEDFKSKFALVYSEKIKNIERMKDSYQTTIEDLD